LEYIEQPGKNTVVAMGNGANDSLMLEYAALGILVIGPEGTAVESLLKVKMVAPYILAALELLLYPKRLFTTLRR
jgi:soluble P-type ATPase